jgi:hypothetical protein
MFQSFNFFPVLFQIVSLLKKANDEEENKENFETAKKNVIFLKII